MKRTKNIPSYMGSVESFEGESIEKKVSKLIENNENYNQWEKDRHEKQLQKLKQYQEEQRKGG
jgi:hypothetical protein